jgi:hypothetical protein
MVRDFLFQLRPDSTWPKAGDEAKSAVVLSGPEGAPTGPSAEAEKPEKGGKGKQPAKGKAAPKKHGSVGGPSGTTG